MGHIMLDLESFHKSVQQLEEALIYCHSELAQDEKLAQHLRAAAIQAFEFTYEISFKTLVRFLKETSLTDLDFQNIGFKDIIRKGIGNGLLNAEVDRWCEFRKNRGTTSRTYNETKAQEVFSHIPEFLEEARFLLAQIETQQRNMADEV
jgi:nucleotidyltransferase substrate binding protein (TIGR01987 family)